MGEHDESGQAMSTLQEALSFTQPHPKMEQ